MTEEGFWDRVDPPGKNGCREWRLSRTFQGYGQCCLSHDVHKSAHRVAWEITYGEIPAGLFVCHRCDNSPCCEPTHLFLGTAADNAADRRRKGGYKDCFKRKSSPIMDGCYRRTGKNLGLDQVRALKTLAVREDRSVPWLIRSAIDKMLRENGLLGGPGGRR